MREDNKFSKERLKQYIHDLNIKFPEVVLAQAELESGHFKSTMFRENKNMFGMKQALRRPTTNKGESRGHAYFSTWKECVLDYALYSATYLSDIKTQAEYLDFLKQNYAEDPSYLIKLNQIIRRNKNS